MQSRNPKWTIAVAAFAAFLATFNETFLNIGFSPIMSDLGVSVSTVQWLATAYMLGAAVMVPVSSFAYRSISTRKLFLSSVGLLIVGSLIGALAQNFQILLAGRIVQALGTGLLIPVGMNITLEVAPKERPPFPGRFRYRTSSLCVGRDTAGRRAADQGCGFPPPR